jgi:hypothetical protein
VGVYVFVGMEATIAAIVEPLPKHKGTIITIPAIIMPTIPCPLNVFPRYLPYVIGANSVILG